MRGHVDAESLALYAEGQLSRGRTVRVRAHLSGCPECTATVAALAEVTTQLSHVPAAPMPAAVAARLDAALNAESARRAAAPELAPAGAPTGAPAPRPPRRGPLWSPTALRVLAAAGVTLVVAGGVGYAVSQSSSSGSRSSSGPASATMHRRSSVHAPNVSPGAPGMRPGISPGSAGPRYVQTGTDYRTSTLTQQAKRELDMAKITGGQPLSSLPSALHACVNSVAGHHSVQLVDRAHYNQQRAVVIVVASTLATDRVIAVTPSCSRLASATLPVTSRPGTG